MSDKRKEFLASALLGVVVAVDFWVTVLGRETQANSVMFLRPFHFILNLQNCFRWSGLTGNTLGNIVLFIPLGVLLPCVWKWARAWYRTAIVAFTFSLSLEVIQLLTRKGCFDLDDLFLNTLGAIVGYGVIALIKKVFRFKLEKASLHI